MYTEKKSVEKKYLEMAGNFTNSYKEMSNNTLN